MVGRGGCPGRATAVLVTHEHDDHLDADAVRTALRSNPELTLWSTPSVAAKFAEFGDQVHEIRHGDALSVAGFDVHVYGHVHAPIHQEIPQVANAGFLVDGELFHPPLSVKRQALRTPVCRQSQNM